MAIISGPREGDLAKLSFQKHQCFLVLTPGAVSVKPLKSPGPEQKMAKHGKFKNSSDANVSRHDSARLGTIRHKRHTTSCLSTCAILCMFITYFTCLLEGPHGKNTADMTFEAVGAEGTRQLARCAQNLKDPRGHFPLNAFKYVDSGAWA